MRATNLKLDSKINVACLSTSLYFIVVIRCIDWSVRGRCLIVLPFIHVIVFSDFVVKFKLHHQFIIRFKVRLASSKES